MRFQVTPENIAAEQLIPPAAPDNSGIGINYADAYIKPMNTQIADGPKVTCKRKGLKILLSIDGKSGDAVMRRADHGPDVRNILRRALETAAERAGGRFLVEEGAIYLEV
jgi:hypothetical protein